MKDLINDLAVEVRSLRYAVNDSQAEVGDDFHAGYASGGEAILNAIEPMVKRLMEEAAKLPAESNRGNLQEQ